MKLFTHYALSSENGFFYVQVRKPEVLDVIIAVSWLLVGGFSYDRQWMSEWEQLLTAFTLSEA